MLTAKQFLNLSNDGQASYLRGLTIKELREHNKVMLTHFNKSRVAVDKYCEQIAASTTDNIRYTLAMLRASKTDTLVDIVARYPKLRDVPAIRRLVAEDFAQYLKPVSGGARP